MEYYLSKKVKGDFIETARKVREVLKSIGFGIMTEIDVKKSLKEKLGVDFRNYLILGACNPPLAYKALQTEDKIGVLLPCNVMLQETSPGEIEIAAMDPMAFMGPVDNPALTAVATEARKRLGEALERM